MSSEIASRLSLRLFDVISGYENCFECDRLESTCELIADLYGECYSLFESGDLPAANGLLNVLARVQMRRLIHAECDIGPMMAQRFKLIRHLTILKNDDGSFQSLLKVFKGSSNLSGLSVLLMKSANLDPELFSSLPAITGDSNCFVLLCVDEISPNALPFLERRFSSIICTSRMTVSQVLNYLRSQNADKYLVGQDITTKFSRLSLVVAGLSGHAKLIQTVACTCTFGDKSDKSFFESIFNKGSVEVSDYHESPINIRGVPFSYDSVMYTSCEKMAGQRTNYSSSRIIGVIGSFWKLDSRTVRLVSELTRMNFHVQISPFPPHYAINDKQDFFNRLHAEIGRLSGKSENLTLIETDGSKGMYLAWLKSLDLIIDPPGFSSVTNVSDFIFLGKPFFSYRGRYQRHQYAYLASVQMGLGLHTSYSNNSELLERIDYVFSSDNRLKLLSEQFYSQSRKFLRDFIPGVVVAP